jgi:hypothetical protein
MPEEKPSRSERKKSAEVLYTQKQVDEMLERKERSLKVHYSLLIEVHQEYELLKKEHEKLKQKLLQYENPDDGYRKDWTWVAKIVFILEKAGRPLRSAEIIELLEKREPYLRDHTSKKQYFSAFLNKALTNERIKREKRKGERGYYYSVSK